LRRSHPCSMPIDQVRERHR